MLGEFHTGLHPCALILFSTRGRESKGIKTPPPEGPLPSSGQSSIHLFQMSPHCSLFGLEPDIHMASRNNTGINISIVLRVVPRQKPVMAVYRILSMRFSRPSRSLTLILDKVPQVTQRICSAFVAP